MKVLTFNPIKIDQVESDFNGKKTMSLDTQ
jgi:hypothetical protein